MTCVRRQTLVRRAFFLSLLVLGAALFTSRGPAEAAEEEILVTNAGDSVETGESECPSDTLCTLRRAIETANGTGGQDPLLIRFDEDVFDAEAATIAVLDTPLPVITRSNVTIDAANEGVIVDGTDLAAVAGADGITAVASAFVVQGLTVRAFPDACLAVDGDGAIIGGSRESSEGNVTDGCARGIVVEGSDAVVQGNLIGMAPLSPGAEPMITGIEASNGDVLVGVSASNEEANVVGNAETGIAFRATGSETMTGVIRGNFIGRASGGSAAPVETGVRIVAPAAEVLVTANRIANVETAISILDGDGSTSTGNTLRGNIFDEVEELAIDLGGDGRTPNDPDSPGGDGANGLLSYPEFDEVLQSEITGKVPGPCAGCTVDLYLAERRLDGRPNVPLTSIIGASAVTNAEGEFSFVEPPVSAGQWLMAIATNSEGNTSEFSDAVRVGAGSMQCAGVTLEPGWNATGYFGGSTTLGNTFPAGSVPPGPVSSIHQLLAGTRDFRSWFANGPGAGSLTSLSTGEPYWFYAISPVEIAGSFTVAEPLPVDLEEGWNDFVYIGAEDAVAGALESIEGQWSALYRWTNDGTHSGWQVYGSPETPGWVRAFDTMTPCDVYLILMSEDGTLTPPRP